MWGTRRTWATQAAAIAAKSNFKEWVNGGRSSQQRAAGAASAAARAEAMQWPPLTTVLFRSSVRLEAAQVTVGLCIGAAGGCQGAAQMFGALVQRAVRTLSAWR